MTHRRRAADAQPASRLAHVPRALVATALLARGIALGGCGHACFVRGTQILTPRGSRSIEDLAVGDAVLSYDTREAIVVERPIVDVLRSHSREILSLRAGDHGIRGVTGEHPFWDARSATWVRAAALTLGHQLLAWERESSTKHVTLDGLRRERARGEVEVFNLTVGGGEEHNYFAEGLLVHNKRPDAQLPDAPTTLDAGTDSGG